MTKIDESREAECRAAFEAWYASKPPPKCNLKRSESFEGHYFFLATQIDWTTWQACWSARDGHGDAVGAEQLSGHACRESDRAMVATSAGQELISKAAQHLRSESAHKFFRPGEIDCPKEIKASNGELHTLRCRICGLDNPKSTACYGDDAAQPSDDSRRGDAVGGNYAALCTICGQTIMANSSHACLPIPIMRNSATSAAEKPEVSNGDK